MEPKLPYEIVQEYVWALTDHLANKSTEQQLLIMDEINRYLEACGWTEREFDDETLKRADADWVNHILN